jgi:glycosyltransferase involved in cell wall biosynthesis
MGYEPNADAADWLMAEVWPRISSEMPHARLLLAGGRPEELRMFMSPPQGVSILGFVPDLAALYGQAHVFVCPVRAGSGTRVKLLEAGAYAKAIVSTTVGAEGLDYQDGVSAIFADDAAAFAQACLALLRDPMRQRSMGHAARELIRKRYERAAVISRIRKLVASTKGVGNA